MFNLYQIVTGAHDGQGLDNLADQFGISRQQADTAVQSLIPALSTAFMTKTMQPGGLGDIAGAMTDDQHTQAYADPGAAQDDATRQKGGDVVGNIFGNNAVVGQVLQQASTYSGIPVSTLEQMLPVVTSMIVGGTATAMNNQGMGGMLGQLASGGLGSILGQFGGAGAMPGTVPGAAPATGGFPGMVGNILGGFFGGGGGGQPAAPAAPPQPDPQAAPGAGPVGGLPPMMQAGMDSLMKLFQPGVPGQAAQPGNLAEMIAASFAQKR